MAKKRKGSEFFDLEAQVDSDEEEEDEDDGEDGKEWLKLDLFLVISPFNLGKFSPNSEIRVLVSFLQLWLKSGSSPVLPFLIFESPSILPLYLNLLPFLLVRVRVLILFF